MYGEGMNEREYASMMKGGENPDLTLQWNIVYVILNILRPWYMLLDYLFLKKKIEKKGKLEKPLPPLLELALGMFGAGLGRRC